MDADPTFIKIGTGKLIIYFRFNNSCLKKIILTCFPVFEREKLKVFTLEVVHVILSLGLTLSSFLFFLCLILGIPCIHLEIESSGEIMIQKKR